MSIQKNIQDILPLVEQPSRYLGTEINTRKKDDRDVKLRFALAFPDLYEIGTSHFGMQILYHILNSHKEIAAERVFAPAVDFEAYLRSSGVPLQTLESSKPLTRFDIVGFSLLYELNYTNMLTMLDLAGIPFEASRRDASYPLIIAGGPCTCNPEPVADFFDAIVIGDGEDVVMKMVRAWLQWEKTQKNDRGSLLRSWSRIEGVYIPVFFAPKYDSAGIQTLSPRFPDYHTVTRAIVHDLDRAPFPDTPVLPYGRPVHDRLRLEISRGCTRGCRFCQAGMIYRPVRERSMETLLDLSDASLAATGYEDISLLSLSTGDYTCITPLMEHLMDHCESRHIAVSLPSIRAGTLTPKLMEQIKRVRKTGFTIAPEAGSPRLRDVINKNISDQEIIQTVENAFRLGWRVIKLYFMIGLPTETEADLQSIVELVNVLRKTQKAKGGKGKAGGNINVSVATFIPKPHTPFQWESQLSLVESKEKINWLRNQLKLPGVRFKWQKPEVSFLEGIWSRGDRHLSRLLVAAYRKGCRFDGWSDKFRFQAWREAFIETGLDVDFYTTRTRNIQAPLTWDHIDTRVTKKFLISEHEKALAQESTPDCRNLDCNACGVCDFEEIAPITFGCVETSTRPQPLKTDSVPSYKTLKLSYSKQGRARFFGHLELVNIFLRALRRAEIPIKHSEGFHPMPKVSFEDPLPIGLESMNESFFLTVPEDLKPHFVLDGLNRHLPEGLLVFDCRPALHKSARLMPDLVVYQITLKDGFFDEKAIECFSKSSEVMVTRTNRKGKQKTINLKNLILKIERPTPDTLALTLKLEPGKMIRPYEILARIFDFTQETIKKARIVKM